MSFHEFTSSQNSIDCVIGIASNFPDLLFIARYTSTGFLGTIHDGFRIPWLYIKHQSTKNQSSHTTHFICLLEKTIIATLAENYRVYLNRLQTQQGIFYQYHNSWQTCCSHNLSTISKLCELDIRAMQMDDKDNTFMSDGTAQIHAVLLANATIPPTHKSLLEDIKLAAHTRYFSLSQHSQLYHSWPNNLLEPSSPTCRVSIPLTTSRCPIWHRRSCRYYVYRQSCCIPANLDLSLTMLQPRAPNICCRVAFHSQSCLFFAPNRKRHGERLLLGEAVIVPRLGEGQFTLSEHAACAAVAPPRSNEDVLMTATRNACSVDTVARSNTVASVVASVPISVSSLPLTRQTSELYRISKPDSKAKTIPKSKSILDIEASLSVIYATLSVASSTSARPHTALVHQDIEVSLQAQITTMGRQTLRSALLTKIKRIKTTSNEFHAELQMEMTLMDEITGKDADTRLDRNEVNQNIVHKRTNQIQKTQVPLAARTQLQAQGEELALDINRLLADYNV